MEVIMGRSLFFKFGFLLLFATVLALLVRTPDAVSGERFPGRIVGGHETEKDAWPWIAYIEMEKEAQGGVEYTSCGASLINPEWLVTAAHCTVGAKSISAVLGRHDLRTAGGEEVDVEKWFVFPFYDAELEMHDISLLKLSRPLDRATIPVAGRDAPADLLYPGKMGKVAGWGNTVPFTLEIDPSKKELSDVLLEVDLPVVDDQQAFDALIEFVRRHPEVLEDSGPLELTPEEEAEYVYAMFGAGYLYREKGAGEGDSGGPFMLQDEQGNWVLAGLVSWSFGDAAQGVYGMYTRVSSYAYWITDMIDGTRVFNYLEDAYPEILGYNGAESELFTAGDIPVHYRYYQDKNALLAVAHNHIFYIGPLSEYQFTEINTLEHWLPLAERAGY